MSNANQVQLTRREPTAAEFREMQQSAQFQELRSKFRSFTFPMSVLFFVWFIGYVLVATYMPDFMATKVFGNVNVGIVLGLLQFVTTFLITWIYIKFANKNIEPRAAAIREAMEG
ncbi:DUF485 domain-containing protein [Corynebacterium epidermidicanis]|uniref:Putative membrane protein n=1 Tax=Corynebacterium epidermidicanis TaxID=1050174 RepID=A0A0G3GUX5_9CORY|nr:DUF485 domain-containing protein [Corynebacterium epidermidicanis]AKK02622.1 putative membrane protein [Corynebacterium epidermidicanis]